MAQQIINYGASVNDGTGDILRTAFVKTDDNFDEIYAAGPVGSNVTITGGTVATTSGDLTLTAQGVNFIVTTNNVQPSANNTHRLGNTSTRYRGAYIGDEGIVSSGNVTAEYFIGDGGLLSNIGGVDTNTYVNAAAFGAGDGVLTLTKNDSSTVTANLDGRYLTSVAFGDLTSTPTTIAGYGITDAFDGQYSSLTGTPTNVSTFTNDSNYIPSDTTGITGADQVTNMVTLTQAEYDAIGTPNASTVYFIVG